MIYTPYTQRRLFSVGQHAQGIYIKCIKYIRYSLNTRLVCVEYNRYFVFVLLRIELLPMLIYIQIAWLSDYYIEYIYAIWIWIWIVYKWTCIRKNLYAWWPTYLCKYLNSYFIDALILYFIARAYTNKRYAIIILYVQ